ncbi:MAG: flagellar hook-basal body complex protein FliE [candidate division Zixibacteria bacterium]|nr:flagellar hook-basal body complex protein FliE [candidate division Zixibacteria bacterium]MDH3937980.1 flagellar hook-basal body complex protein FliE [candidate division Zixibacteria bacterium]MDH4033162.1 flagellar hook-basal body complex protein FliE [candidate division Zixibacteria bacterium]
MGIGINNTQRLVPGLIERPGGKIVDLPKDETVKQANFTEMLSGLVNNVNELHDESGRIQQAFLAGEPVELHQIMIKAEQAGIATDLLLEIRNKLMTAYNEIMRMPL